jgi:hypothetical protein
MNTTKLIAALAVSGGLDLSVAAQADEKEHEEQEINSSDIPAAVQKAAEKEAGGAQIVRWEKERGNYEAVIEKHGKQWGYVFSKSGKVVSKHDESKEKREHER